ncbi:MAG: ABC transporter permease [Anaerovoracaceae bacterium]
MQALNLNVKSAYESDREEYAKDRRESTGGAIAMGLIMLAISLIEILLMTRSSFLSRIKEIGIYRAIGVKKTDIYKMFLGEIFAVTTIGSLTGIGVMTYILYHLLKIEMLSSMFALNIVVVGGAIAIVYVFNAIVGLIPVFSTMRKSPAAILARHDVD